MCRRVQRYWYPCDTAAYTIHSFNLLLHQWHPKEMYVAHTDTPISTDHGITVYLIRRENQQTKHVSVNAVKINYTSRELYS